MPHALQIAPLGDRRNMAYLGTAVTDGRGQPLLTATGLRTEVGRIGTLIDAAGARNTPLERKQAHLGHALIGVVLALCAVIVLTGGLRGHEFLYMLKVGISLAIAAVHEGLPAVATMTQALGMARMHALVRRLPAVATLGSTTVICPDKTGTLTRDEMTVRVLQLGERRIHVSGAGTPQPASSARAGGPLEPRVPTRTGGWPCGSVPCAPTRPLISPAMTPPFWATRRKGHCSSPPSKPG